jgi:hypothetical protein
MNPHKNFGHKIGWKDEASVENTVFAISYLLVSQWRAPTGHVEARNMWESGS